MNVIKLKSPLAFSLLVIGLMLVFGAGSATHGQAIPVKIAKSNSGQWEMTRGGKPYSIKGAGGEGSFALLAACGGNSGRTWGVGDDTQARLDEAHKRGISVAFGIWLEHERKGFDYGDEKSVQEQFELVLSAVKKYKDHPAVLVWGIGNEMEGYETGDSPKIWGHVEKLAAEIKKIDPHHPTMSVIAEIGGRKIPAIHEHCPSLDIIGINSYGGAASLPERYKKTGGTKPYIVTEFGPIGTWEVPKNSIGAIDEPTSTEKVRMYRDALGAFANDPNCLGYYAFLWGNKQEATATWFGLLLPDGKKTGPVDYLTRLWTGKAAKNLCPTIQKIELNSPPLVGPGKKIIATVKATDPEGKPLNYRWMLLGESDSYVTSGDFQKTPPAFQKNVKSVKGKAVINAPEVDGIFRLYAFVDDGNAAAATTNTVFRVQKDPTVKGADASLPFVVFDEIADSTNYFPSGWMGNTGAMTLNGECTENPHSGDVCVKVDYRVEGAWGGVVWQNPENDWGEKPGGFDLSSAKKLTFWARGKTGGEKVKFGMGLLGREKKFYDTTTKELALTLGTEWKQYTLDLTKTDLSRIKSGFYFSLAGQGKPMTFFLDRIVYE